MKQKWINNLEIVSKIIASLIEDDYITKNIKDKDFLQLTKEASYYQIDEVIDYLYTLIDYENNK